MCSTVLRSAPWRRRVLPHIAKKVDDVFAADSKDRFNGTSDGVTEWIKSSFSKLLVDYPQSERLLHLLNVEDRWKATFEPLHCAL
jgi:hypothetical protein